jgi:hypothetical protein
MLFHQLPDTEETYKILHDLAYGRFSFNIVGLMNLVQVSPTGWRVPQQIYRINY